MWKRLSLLWILVKGDARLLWLALRHPQAPGWLKLGALGIVVYLISPIDLIPDVVPVLGVVDDLVLVPLAVRWLYRRLPEALRAEIEQRAAGARPQSAQSGAQPRTPTGQPRPAPRSGDVIDG